MLCMHTYIHKYMYSSGMASLDRYCNMQEHRYVEYESSQSHCRGKKRFARYPFSREVRSCELRRDGTEKEYTATLRRLRASTEN